MSVANYEACLLFLARLSNDPDLTIRWLSVRQELALKEALAWEGYAGAVGDDHEEAVKALRRSERLMVRGCGSHLEWRGFVRVRAGGSGKGTRLTFERLRSSSPQGCGVDTLKGTQQRQPPSGLRRQGSVRGGGVPLGGGGIRGHFRTDRNVLGRLVGRWTQCAACSIPALG